MDSLPHVRFTRKQRLDAARTLLCEPQPPEVQSAEDARQVLARMRSLEVMDTVLELVRSGAVIKAF